MKPGKPAKSRENPPPTGDSVKVGNLVIPSSFSKYKGYYPAKLVVAVEERGDKPNLVSLEGEEGYRFESDLIIVSS